MANVSTYNITHIMNNPECLDGVGCFFKNINDVGQGFPFLAILLMTYVIATFGMIKAGNDTLKSFIASTFLMMFLVIIGYIYELIGDIWTVSAMIILAVLAGVAIYLNRNK